MKGWKKLIYTGDPEEQQPFEYPGNKQPPPLENSIPLQSVPKSLVIPRKIGRASSVWRYRQRKNVRCIAITIACSKLTHTGIDKAIDNFVTRCKLCVASEGMRFEHKLDQIFFLSSLCYLYIGCFFFFHLRARCKLCAASEDMRFEHKLGQIFSIFSLLFVHRFFFFISGPYVSYYFYFCESCGSHYFVWAVL